MERPLVGDTGDDWFYMPDSGAGVIDPDVLWSCVTCGACVEQCPVDIEHVDHIVDMRRYQVLVESNFPTELNGLFKGLENKGNPWNMSATARMDWAKDLPFDVKVVGEDVESLDEVEWLFWVGCAGAYEDRAKKTTRAVAELLDMAGVNFAVLGNGETCNGDSARRAGNEFVFQGLAQQNIETFKEYKVKKVVSTCAHCFNTLKNEYRDLGYKMEVVHHTQLLNRLVREKKLTPIRTPERSWKGPHQRPITYHDPCYIGRHNQVYEAPRELLNVIPDTQLVEMPRNSERSFCCGAGGARMWMEETIGSRINETRTAEAVATGADQIAVGCPFCRVMLSDGLTAQQANGNAREEVEVLDVAQMLLAAVKGESKPAKKQAAAKSGAKAESKGGDEDAGGGTAVMTKEADEATKAEPEAGDATQTEETVTATEDVGAAAKASSGGGSLFDIGGDDDSADSGDDSADADEPKSEETDDKAEAKTEEKSGDEGFGGGSLFDVGGDESAESEKPAAEPKVEHTGGEVDRSEDDADTDVTPEGETEAETKGAASGGATSTPGTEIPEGGSLFDIAEPEESAPAAKSEPTVEETPAKEDPAGDSTTDADVDRSEDDADTDVTPEGDTEAETETETEEAPASGGATSTPGTEIPEGGSLFDIAEPEESAPAAETQQAAEQAADEDADATEEDPAGDSTTDADVDRSEDDADADVSPDSEPEEDTSGSTDTESTDDGPLPSLRDIKAKYAEGSASADTDTTADAESEDEPSEPEESDEPDDESGDDEAEESDGSGDSDSEDSDSEDQKPKPGSSGETHQPRTDAEIGEGGSLFDL